MSAQVAFDELSEDAALPRSNGELVFEHPWESLSFGLVLALCECGAIEWEEFRSELIATIAGWTDNPRGEWSYYTCWLAALETVLERSDLLGAVDLEVTEARIRHELDHDDGSHEHPHEH